MIDDNKLKLLKMKEKLLEVTPDKTQILKDYKELAISVDTELYNSVVKMLKETDYQNLPLNGQLTFLTQALEQYNVFYELMCQHKNVYESYSIDTFELTFVDEINVDNLKSRISAIEGYLANEKNINENNIAIDRLNKELLDEEKTKTSISEKCSYYEKELRNNFLIAEGRIKDSDDNIKYTSIKTEYQNNDLDVDKLLDDDVYLAEEIAKAETLEKTTKDKVAAANICYQNMPNNNTKELFNSSYREYLKAAYKRVLVMIANVISKSYDDFRNAKAKREELKVLIGERNFYLTYMNVRFFVDPFTRMKLDEQLEIIDKFKDNDNNIGNIKERITNAVNYNDQLVESQRYLLEEINRDSAIVTNKQTMSTVIDGMNIEVTREQPEENKVINMKDISTTFNSDRVREKTTAVIKRVKEMFVPNVQVKEEEQIPELLIEESNSETETAEEVFTPVQNEVSEEVPKEEKVETENTQDIFTSVSNDIFESVPEPTEEVTLQPESDNTTNIFNSVSEEIFTPVQNEVFEEAPKEEIKEEVLPSKIEESLFEEIEPFNRTELFEDRRDDIMPADKPVSQKEETVSTEEDSMPDMFWTTAETEQPESDEKVVSFDDQINALIESEEEAKVRKLAA